MKISTELKNKAKYDNMKYSVITECGRYISEDNLVEAKKTAKRFNCVIVKTRSIDIRFICVGGRCYSEGTKKFNSIEIEG